MVSFGASFGACIGVCLRGSGQALEWFQDFGWLQGHQSGFRGLVAPCGEWLQVVRPQVASGLSGSKWQVALSDE